MAVPQKFQGAIPPGLWILLLGTLGCAKITTTRGVSTRPSRLVAQLGNSHWCGGLLKRQEWMVSDLD